MNTFEITIQRKSGNAWPIVIRHQTDEYDLITWAYGSFELDLQKLIPISSTSKEYGTLLGKALFRDDIRDTFVQAMSSQQALRVLLIIEAEDLRILHWEQLCAPFPAKRWDSLLLNQQTLFSLYMPSQIERRFPPIGRRDLYALLLVAGPEQIEGNYELAEFDVPATVSSIRNALGGIPCDVFAPIAEAKGQARLDTLCEQLTRKKYTLLHIICHGRITRDTNETMLFFPKDKSGKPVTGTELITRLSRINTAYGLPHFIYLSTCHSANPQAENGLGGLGQRLVRELGTPAVLAMTDRISIATAEALGQTFYTRLKEHGEVDRALTEALTSLPGKYDVTVPALFSRLGGRPLFSDTLDRPLTNAEIGYGLKAATGLIEQHAPILLKELQNAATTLQSNLDLEPAALAESARVERSAALGVVNNLCNEALDISFNALALGRKAPAYNTRCPFKGLEPFRAEDRDFFFGRETLVNKLVRHSQAHNFLAILGPSGSGKSSVVLAGLLPKL